MKPEDRLLELDITLPPALPPNGTYVPYRTAGNLLFLSGHGPRLPDNTYRLGRFAKDEQIPDGYADARLAALNMLASIKSALGSLDRVDYFVKLVGMVHAEPNFTKHSRIVDGCSDLLLEVFGDRGSHARSAVGMSSLPHGMTIELEAVILVRD